MTVSLPYVDLEGHLSKLDRRKTDYQFDLENDVPWDRVDEPGDFLPADLARDLGLDVDGLQANPEAWAMFQWGCALLTCEGFIMAEKQIIDFFGDEPALLRRHSNQLLNDEELKHIAMFRRYADALRDQHPDWSFTFDRLFVDTSCEGTATDTLRMTEDVVTKHLVFWLAVVFFEEVTLYLHKRFTAADGIQVAWRAVHECHMREEAQHLRTDMAHLEVLTANAAEWREGLHTLEVMIGLDFSRAFGFRVGLAMVAEAFPELKLRPPAEQTTTEVYQDIVARHPMFRRTRALLAGEVGSAAAELVDRPGRERPANPRSADEIEAWLRAALAEALEIDPARITPTTDLPSLSLDSGAATELAARLEDWLGLRVSPTIAWDHKTLRDLAQHLSGGAGE